MTRLPRILSAVPQLPHVHLEIAKAIQALAAPDEQRSEVSAEFAKAQSEREAIAEIVRDAWQILRKAGFNPDEPRVPAGNPDGGRWTTEGGTQATNDSRVLSDAVPENTWQPGAQYAANVSANSGQTQNSASGGPPAIPAEEPATAKAVNAFLKAAAYWLAAAALAGEPAGDFILALEAAEWLYDYLPYIDAYLDPPKTWEELQQNALSPQVGYDIHHPVEQTPAEQYGFSADQIDAPENRLLIPTLKHWLITAWYSTQNEEFGGLSPRDYLRDKSWDERMRVARIALIRFGVLQP